MKKIIYWNQYIWCQEIFNIKLYKFSKIFLKLSLFSVASHRLPQQLKRKARIISSIKNIIGGSVRMSSNRGITSRILCSVMSQGMSLYLRSGDNVDSYFIGFILTCCFFGGVYFQNNAIHISHSLWTEKNRN